MTAITKKVDRFLRVEMLLGIGTEALRIKFDQLHKPETLQDTLRIYKPKIMRNISKEQKTTLYPTTGIASSTKMDMTLMVCVLRNTGLAAPASTFDCMPVELEISDGADVARLKCYRNEFAHSTVRELDENEFEKISKALIEVIKRFSGSTFDADIKVAMDYSLDHRAKSFKWHTGEAISLAQNALCETVIKPAMMPVIRLYGQQPLHYTVIGGTVLAYGMKNKLEIPSIGELNYFMSVVNKVRVRQCFKIDQQYPYFSQTIAELMLCQPATGISIDGNVTFPVSISDSFTFDLDLPRLHSQYGLVQQVSMVRVIDSPCSNYQQFEVEFYMANLCRKNNIGNYGLSHQANSTSDFKCTENNFDGTCQMESRLPSSRTFPSNSTYYMSYNDIKIPHSMPTEMISIPTVEPMHNVLQVSTPLSARCELHLNANSSCLVRTNEINARNEPAIEKTNEEPCCCWYLFLIFISVFFIFFFTWLVYNCLLNYFKSRLIAVSLTVILLMMFMFFYWMVKC